MKANYAKDTIRSLLLESGEFVEGEEKVMKMIDEHFRILFSKYQQTEDNEVERVAVLGLINKTMTDEENEELVKPPSEDEIDRVVHDFPIGKAPGIDGVTVEILIECWDFIKQDCYRMVEKFWEEGILSSKAMLGVIKLAFKGGGPRYLKN